MNIMNQLIIIKNFYLALHAGAKAIRALRVKCVKIRLFTEIKILTNSKSMTSARAILQKDLFPWGTKEI